MRHYHEHRCIKCGDLWRHISVFALDTPLRLVSCGLPLYAACDRCVGKKPKKKRKRGY